MQASTVLVSLCILLAFAVEFSIQERTCPLIGIGSCSPVRNRCRSNSDCAAQGKICCPVTPSPGHCGDECVDGVEIPSMEEFMAQFNEAKQKLNGGKK